jgi:hypothetical protein
MMANTVAKPTAIILNPLAVLTCATNMWGLPQTCGLNMSVVVENSGN